jgi:uncharacterized protein (UPF0333 family)
MFSKESKAQGPVRGQGAIEYLLIIGAAILVVAIVTIAIITVISQGQAQNSSAITSAESAFDSLKENSGAYFRINNNYYLKSDPLSQNLITIWRFDKISQTGTVSDSVGSNSLTCSSPNCPTIVNGLFGEYALQFNGSNQYFSSSTFPNSLERTISVWIKPEFSWDNGAADDKDYFLFTTNVGSVTNQGYIVVRNYYNDFVFYVCSYTPTNNCGVEWDISNNQILIQSNNWYFLTFVSSKKNNFLKIYINGVEKMTYPNATFDSSTMFPGITVGKSNGGTTESHFKGTMAEISIWDRALSASDVNALYNNALKSS